MTDDAFRAYILRNVNQEPREDGTSCWIWLKSQARRRTIYLNGRSARRVVYEEFLGPIPADGFRRIVMECGRKQCLSPEHMRALTHAEERILTRSWKGRAIEVQADIRADGTARVRAFTPFRAGQLRKIRGAEDLGNGEFELPSGCVKFIGRKSHETIHQYVKNARERLGDAGDGFDGRKRVNAREWTEFKQEEEEFLGIADGLDIG